MSMRLRILLPTEVLVDTEATKVIAEARDGSFCLLPRHIDYATALVPGILAFFDGDGRERLVAVDEGTLVKRAGDVLVSVMQAVEGDDLASLREALDANFRMLDEEERSARSALSRLEAGALRRFIELEQETHG